MNKIAIGQLCSSSNLQQNLKTVITLVNKAIDQDVKLIFFPEATDYIAQSPSHSKYLVKQTPSFVCDLQASIKSIVRTRGKQIDVSIGVHLPANSVSTTTVSDNRVRNVLLYINHEGKIINEYQKLHLFDVDVPNGPILKESESVQPGRELPQIVNTPAGKLGSAICYDIRFPELSLALRSAGAEIICYPSAFTMKTGEAHWELLAGARAIDTQCYVIMPGQDGIHNTTDPEWDKNQIGIKKTLRQSWGHSMIVDPWGTIIAKANSNNKEPQLICADIDLSKLKTIREKMPLWQQRRNDIFH